MADINRAFIEALPWYKRASLDSAIQEWDRDNTLTRFLQGAGNKEGLQAIVENWPYEDFRMFDPNEPAPLPPPRTPEPETPGEDPAPVEDELTK